MRTIFLIAISSFFITVCFTFFIGMFYNPPIITQLYDTNHRYYINRGYPIAWSGVTRSDMTVKYPLILAPFLPSMQSSPSIVQSGKYRYSKIIYLRIFLPLFIKLYLLVGLLIFPFVMVAQWNAVVRGMLIVFFALSILGSIFSYFYLFPRI